jgi:hypothetical protein
MTTSKPSNVKKLINIVATGKGGVGKTTYAVKLAEWYLRQGITPTCIDADAFNQGLALKSYPTLETESLNMLDGNAISEVGYNKMLDIFDKEDGPFIVDIGSNTYHPFVNYAATQKLPRVLERIGCRVQFHAIVGTGLKTPDCISSIEYLSASLPWPFMVVLNEFDGGHAEISGVQFKETPVFSGLLSAKKINGLIRIPKMSPVQAAILEELKEFRLTTAEIVNDGDVPLSTRVTIESWADGFFDEFDNPSIREAITQ